MALYGPPESAMPPTLRAIEPVKMRERPPRMGWESLAAVAAAATGIGLLVVVTGGLIAWIRLTAAGLPAEYGVSLIPAPLLAVEGFRYLVLPVAINALAWLVTDQYMQRQMDVAIRATKEGKAIPDPVFREQRAWAAVKRIGRRAWTYRGVRWIGWILFIPLVPFGLLEKAFARVGLGAIYVPALWIVSAPLSWGWVVLVIGAWGAFKWSSAVHKSVNALDRAAWRRARLRASAGFAILAMAVALAGQADYAPRFAEAVVRTDAGVTIHGLHIADRGDAVFLAQGRQIEAIPRDHIVSVRIGHEPKRKGERRRAPIEQLFDWVLL